jgi:hypothetical protein
MAGRDAGPTMSVVGPASMPVTKYGLNDCILIKVTESCRHCG